jgi:hypothetical protein
MPMILLGVYQTCISLSPPFIAIILHYAFAKLGMESALESAPHEAISRLYFPDFILTDLHLRTFIWMAYSAWNWL